MSEDEVKVRGEETGGKNKRGHLNAPTKDRLKGF